MPVGKPVLIGEFALGIFTPLIEQSTAKAEECAFLGRKAHPSFMHLFAF
jgi:hypothetical protein